MAILKLSLVLCFASTCLSKHIIPIEEYKTELTDLGQHVEYPEPPIKTIRITKTIAIKVPVPYPVKVIEKVPYPVHVAKPYPVPVPHIVKVPQQAKHAHGHKPEEHYPLGHNDEHFKLDHHEYHVQEHPSEHSAGGGHSFGGDDHNVHSFGDEYGFDGSHHQPAQGYSEHSEENDKNEHGY